MSSLLTAQDWIAYGKLMDDAWDTFAPNENLTWFRLRTKLDRFGEDNTDNFYDEIPLRALNNYNYMRSWPVTSKTEAGGLDKESVQVLINKNYLKSLGYLNAQGYFDYNSVEDYFVMDGIRWLPFGDTPASQVAGGDLFITLILRRDIIQTGTPR
jgi:hypothetical protein